MANLDPDPHNSSYGPEYWNRCEGFRVESTRGEIGTVKGLRFQASLEPGLLEVGSGLFGRRVRLVPVERVAEIVPDQKPIVLYPRDPVNETV